jgi:4-hydroxyphenylpyruvate dioxygenase
MSADSVRRRAIATVSLSGTLADKLDAAARAGFDGVEIFEGDLVTAPWSPGEVRRRLSELGLTADLYQPFRDYEAVAPATLAANLRRAEAKFDVMQALGATTMLVCSNVTEEAVDDDDLAAEQLHQLADRAADRGLRIAYEALAWGRHVSQYDHSWRIVQRADHPALGVCLDSFHILSRATDLATIAEIPGEKIFFLQLADAPRLRMDVLQWSRHYRCFPGQGGFDLAHFLARVLDAGYGGPLSLEVFNDVFRRADPDRMAIDAMRSLLLLEEATHGRTGRAPARSPALDVSGALPAAPALLGYAFTELAVDPAQLAFTERLLAALGFTAAGRHRFKPVTRWRAGTANVLVNATDGEAHIAAIAVETADPAQSARRAKALLAPILARDRGPVEADLPAVAAPDATAVFFCRSDAEDAESWLRDFAALPWETAARGTAMVTGIDHLALSQPFDFFDEAALFYRAILGLELHDNRELASPDGLVRSRAASSPDGSVRLALNVPLLADGETAGPQHIALATGDAISAARRLREQGVALLEIPQNYYADLAARVELEPELLRCMSELGVLYDRDAHGELLHFYTAMVGSRLFVEVVERRRAYAGYGAVNAPVRMAAQRALSPLPSHTEQPRRRAMSAMPSPIPQGSLS